LFDGKVDIVGVWGGQNLKFKVIFKSAGKNAGKKN